METNLAFVPKEKTDELATLKKKHEKLLKYVKGLEKDKQAKESQLKNSESMLKEVQTKILKTNLKIDKLSSQENEKTRKKVSQMKLGEDRDMEEINKKLKEKLFQLATKRQPLIPIKDKPISSYKTDENEIMLVHSVKILYLKGMRDGEIEKFDRSNVLEVTVRLLKTTTFTDLKYFACKYWNIEEKSNFSLRASNFALLEHLKGPVEAFLRDQRAYPELWIIQNNIDALKSLTAKDDYFIDENTKNQFVKNSSTRMTETDINSKILNYQKFIETFEGFKGFLPKVSKIDEESEVKRLDSWELNIQTLLVAFVLIIVSIIAHYVFGDYEVRYWISYQMIQTLSATYTSGSSK
jgi:hypothetical protein